MSEQRKIKKAINHILGEIGLERIEESIRKGRFKELQKAHNSIHEFIYLAPLCVPSGEKVTWRSKSAFLTFHWEVFHLAHRSFLEALAGYYNAAYSLLRNTLELLLKGAFWECLAHKRFRDKAQVTKKWVVKIGKDKKTLLNWFEDIIKLKPSIEEEFEKTSAAIYDKIFPIPEDPDLKRLVPLPKQIIEQLSEWGIFDPVLDPAERIYKIYSNLSADVHVIPDKTDIGRRLLKERELFETVVIPEELSKLSNLLHKVIDIGIVIELNIFCDWIQQNGVIKDKLKERLILIEKDLQLSYASVKIKNLIGER